ncbi:hypothetical protein D5085_01485 [Ectothiorhodospiraceae bacterium BW-2]|nr:hypothetical protein D5085_01485 [Ectothiorhodospiraceae bacterium BW-2]
MSPQRRCQWHRLFGLRVQEPFHDSPYRVEVEIDVAKVPQFLDVVVEQCEARDWAGANTLPDGLQPLRPHNLITFKSHHESLSDWSVKELVGYYVSYRKQLSESGKRPP